MPVTLRGMSPLMCCHGRDKGRDGRDQGRHPLGSLPLALTRVVTAVTTPVRLSIPFLTPVPRRKYEEMRGH